MAIYVFIHNFLSFHLKKIIFFTISQGQIKDNVTKHFTIFTIYTKLNFVLINLQPKQ